METPIVNTPKYSIIVGVYNQIKTLPKLIQSLEMQSQQDFEVHFCDDGSDDGSDRFLNRYTLIHENWHLHRQTHRGMRLARNLNQGIRKAKGEYCVFVMGDSFMEPDYLEVLDDWAAPHRFICGIRIHVDNGQGVDIDWRVKKGVVPEFPAIIISNPAGSMTGNGLTVPIDFLREYGGWDQSLEGYGGDDNELIARMFYKAKLIPWSVPDLRLYHHWHKASESVNQSQVNKFLQAYAS